jgi:hypothetical protein
MKITEMAKTPAGSPTTDGAPVFRAWIGDWRVLAVAGLAVAGTGLAHSCRFCIQCNGKQCPGRKAKAETPVGG